MKPLLTLAVLSSATILFTGCVVEEETGSYHRRGANYGEGPRYRERSDVVVYGNSRDNDDRRRRSNYEERDVSRTNVRERNVSVTNVHEKQNTRRVSATRGRVANQVQVQTKVVEKGKKKHDDKNHDEERQ